MSKYINLCTNLAYDWHKNQRRKHSAMPYMIHLERCRAYVDACFNDNINLLLCGDDYDDVIGAVKLHDSAEDVGITEKEMLDEGVSQLTVDIVRQLTNVPKSAGNRAARKKIDNERLAKSSNYVKIIKLADRLDNVSDLIVSKSMNEITSEYFQLYLNETQELLKHIWVDCNIARLLKKMVNYHLAKENWDNVLY